MFNQIFFDMNSFKISVIIPLYNKKDSIVNAIKSVLNQSYEVDEILILNDGSTDGSELIIKQHINTQKLKIINQKNQGVSSARNKGVELAKNNWLAFLDADDEWLPKFIETCVNLKINNENCDFIATAYSLCDKNGLIKNIILRRLKFYKEGQLINYFEVASHSHPPFCSSSVLIKKELLQKINGFPIRVTSGEDLLTWAKLATITTIAYSNIPLSIYNFETSTQSNNQTIRTPDKTDFVGQELNKLLRNSNDPYLKTYNSHWHKMRASVYLKLGQNKNAFKETLISLKYNFKNFKLYLYLFMLLLPQRFRIYLFNYFGF